MTEKRTLVCLVENKPGVLNRVVSLFRRRNFNMDSLTVGRTENQETSRITIVMEGDRASARQVAVNLYKLIDVIEVQDVTDVPNVSRDLVLVKVQAPDAHSRNLVTDLCYRWGARLVDIGPDVTIVELAGTADSIEDFVEDLRPFGIVEMVRTGVVSMARGVRKMQSADYRSQRFNTQRIRMNGQS
ncbi:MAG: acetolactate synthase small subunit [Chloroflexi bacterium]|nr:acetolactate synthase small subunit [Chloroflexota bacterium]